MAEYEIRLSRKAVKELDKMHDGIAQPVLNAIAALAMEPRPSGCKKLKGV